MATGKRAELDAMAARGDAVAELVVVAEIIGERFEAADFGEAPLGSRHHGAEHEIEAATATEPCDEHAGREIGAIAERFEIGGERSVGEPAIEAGDAADRRIAERRGDRPQESGIDADVAIGDDEDVVPRLARHAGELVDLVADAHGLRADQQTDRRGRENRA